MILNPIRDLSGNIKAEQFQLTIDNVTSDWTDLMSLQHDLGNIDGKKLEIQFMSSIEGEEILSSKTTPTLIANKKTGILNKMWSYLLWLTIMVGFWATMSLSIADITRYAASQKSQVMGQFVGLPGTMMLYSFVGIFVTCAAVVHFDDVLIRSDAPWDPVSLLAKFDNPIVVVIAQIFMIHRYIEYEYSSECNRPI